MSSAIFVTFAALLFLTVLPAAERAGAAEEGVAHYRVGEAEVWALADSIGERDMGVFAGADPETLRRLVSSGKAATAVMAFAVRNKGKLFLIDAGLGNPSGERASRLMAGLERAGLQAGDVSAVLVTHMHGDHIGGLLRDGKKAFPNAVVLLSRPERDFWLDEKSIAAFPARKANFEQAARVLAIYGDATDTFAFGDEAVPGLMALDGSGHTPGQAVFLLESAGARLLFMADLVHAAAVQFPRPDLNASYDMDPARAAATRALFLDRAATENLPVAGAHLPFPAVGRVEKSATGGYRYDSLLLQ